MEQRKKLWLSCQNKEYSTHSESNSVVFLLHLTFTQQLSSCCWVRLYSPPRSLPLVSIGNPRLEVKSKGRRGPYAGISVCNKLVLSYPKDSRAQPMVTLHPLRQHLASPRPCSRLGSLCVLNDNSLGSVQEILSFPRWLTRKLVISQFIPGGDLTHSQGEKELASGDDGPPLANLWLVVQPQSHWQPR